MPTPVELTKRGRAHNKANETNPRRGVSFK